MRVLNTSTVEEKVISIYHSLNIFHPSQIYHDDLIEIISRKFNIKVYYFDETSEANNLGDIFRIFLNEHQTKQKICKTLPMNWPIY